MNEKIDKTLKRVENMVKFLGNDLRFNEVHLKSYENEKGKIRYKGFLRVRDELSNFDNLTLNEIDMLLSGVIMGYLFCEVKNEYKK